MQQEFGGVEDPHVHGHRIIEQYQAQIWPAVKAAFEDIIVSPDLPGQFPLLWEAGCGALVAYVSNGLALDGSALRRSVGLLSSWLEKNVATASGPSHGHPQPDLLLPVLAALARLYIIALEPESDTFPPFHSQLYALLEPVRTPIAVATKRVTNTNAVTS